MNNLFSAHWIGTSRNANGQEPDWLQPQPSGFGRLLAAIAIIGIAVCFLDHAAGKSPADTKIASSYGLSQQGR